MPLTGPQGMLLILNFGTTGIAANPMMLLLPPFQHHTVGFLLSDMLQKLFRAPICSARMCHNRNYTKAQMDNSYRIYKFILSGFIAWLMI